MKDAERRAIAVLGATYFPAPVGREMKTSFFPANESSSNMFGVTGKGVQTSDDRSDGFLLDIRSEFFETKLLQALRHSRFRRH